jgi:hypothetical protein
VKKNVNHTGSLLATWVIVSVNIMIKFPRGKDEFEIERHVVAGRKYSLLSPREYLVPSRSEETQLNISFNNCCTDVIRKSLRNIPYQNDLDLEVNL